MTILQLLPTSTITNDLFSCVPPCGWTRPLACGLLLPPAGQRWTTSSPAGPVLIGRTFKDSTSRRNKPRRPSLMPPNHPPNYWRQPNQEIAKRKEERNEFTPCVRSLQLISLFREMVDLFTQRWCFLLLAAASERQSCQVKWTRCN